MQIELTESQLQTLMWSLGVAKARANTEGMPFAANSIWELTKDLIAQHALANIQGNCGYVPNDPNVNVAICELCGARIKVGEFGLWVRE